LTNSYDEQPDSVVKAWQKPVSAWKLECAERYGEKSEVLNFFISQQSKSDQTYNSFIYLVAVFSILVTVFCCCCGVFCIGIGEKETQALAAGCAVCLCIGLLLFNAALLSDYIFRANDMEKEMRNESECALRLSQITECMGGGQISVSDSNSLVKSLLYENYNNIKIMLIFWFSLLVCLIISPLCIVGV